MNALKPIVLLSLLVGCGNGSSPTPNNNDDNNVADMGSPDSAPDEGAADCVSDETRPGGPCGLNGRGTLVERCTAGAWVETATCDDIDACTDGELSNSETPCGPGDAGLLETECVDGQWEETEECTGLCTEDESRPSATACGAFGAGFVLEICSFSEWVEWTWRDGGSCDDPSAFEGLGELNPGAQDATSQYEGVYVGGDKFVFIADTSAEGRELFVSDGTAGGTRLLRAFNPGIADGLRGMTGFINPAGMKVRDRGLVVAEGGANDGIWSTDGTDTGTVQLSTFAPRMLAEPRVARGGAHAFFQSIETVTPMVNRHHVFVTDGTVAGTVELMDYLTPQSLGRVPISWPDGSKSMFSVIGPPGSGSDLYCTDGTAAGTVLVGSHRGNTDDGAFVGGAYVFTGEFLAGNYTLMSTDCVTITELAPVSVYPRELVAFGTDQILFEGDDVTSGRELWTWDLAGGARMVKDIVLGAAGTNFFAKVPFGDHVLVVHRRQASDPYVILSTDGTAPNTLDLLPNAPLMEVPKIVARGDQFAYWVSSNGNGDQLYLTNGSAADLLDDGARYEPMLMMDGRLVYTSTDIDANVNLMTVNLTSESRAIVRSFAEPMSIPRVIGLDVGMRMDYAVFEVANDPFSGLEPWVLRK